MRLEYTVSVKGLPRLPGFLKRGHQMLFFCVFSVCFYTNWNKNQFKLTLDNPSLTEETSQVTVSPDGRFFTTLSRNSKVIKLWKKMKGTCIIFIIDREAMYPKYLWHASISCPHLYVSDGSILDNRFLIAKVRIR